MPQKRQVPSWADAAVLEHNRLVGEYKKESDRATAILAASHLDVLLEWVLRDHLVPGKSTDELFDGQGPLATFSGKIKMAFALGLMQPSAFHDFEVVRKIRNRFAHDTETASFDVKPVSDWCNTFAMVNWPGFPSSGKPRPARDWFITTIAGLSAWADWARDRIAAGINMKCVPPPESERFGE